MSSPEIVTADSATAEWLRRIDRLRVGLIAAWLGLTVLFAGNVTVSSLVVGTVWLAVSLVAVVLLWRRGAGPVGRVRTLLLSADVIWITALLRLTSGASVVPYIFVVIVASGALHGRAAALLTVWASLGYALLRIGDASALVGPLAATTMREIMPGIAALVGCWLLMRLLARTGKRHQAWHRLLFEASPRPMYIIDAESNAFLAVNDAALRSYGYSREEFQARRLEDIRDRDEGQEPGVAASGVTDAHQYGIWRHRRRDGSLIDVEVASHPMTIAGRAARLVVETDVTDRTRLEARLRQTQRLEALGRLAGGVAHEFNNLLAAVHGHAELLKPPGLVADEGRESVDEIVRAAQRGAELTRHMLAFGRRQLLRPEVVDVSAVVRDMERLLRPVLSADLRVTLSVPEPCFARVDRSQLDLIIMNLAMNARDAMTAGGVLTIETSRVELGPADRARHPTVALVAGPYIRLVVSDTGTGIAPEIRDRIFEPFFTTKPVGRGTGLGLSTVYGIVKQSEGYVWVYSEPGRGTSMHVYLPAGVASHGDEQEPHHGLARGAAGGDLRAIDGSTSRSLRVRRDGARAEVVLVAEDDPAVRGAAVRLLRDARYQVIEASSAEEALAVVDDGTVDVLVTDIVMPGQDGVALATRLSKARPSLRVVYMSGYPQSHLAAAGTLPGGNAFVDKPFTANALLAAVAGTRE